MKIKDFRDLGKAAAVHEFERILTGALAGIENP
jgi:hypothetical protein